MSVTATGAEFKRFYADPVFWPDGVIHDDVLLQVDGRDGDHFLDYSEEISDAAEVHIEAGVVAYENQMGEPFTELADYFRQWQKRQSVTVLVVEVDAGAAQAVREAVEAAGGRVVAR